MARPIEAELTQDWHDGARPSSLRQALLGLGRFCRLFQEQQHISQQLPCRQNGARRYRMFVQGILLVSSFAHQGQRLIFIPFLVL